MMGLLDILLDAIPGLAGLEARDQNQLSRLKEWFIGVERLSQGDIPSILVSQKEQ
jgi:hypothetical protein